MCERAEKRLLVSRPNLLRCQQQQWRDEHLLISIAMAIRWQYDGEVLSAQRTQTNLIIVLQLSRNFPAVVKLIFRILCPYLGNLFV